MFLLIMLTDLFWGLSEALVWFSCHGIIESYSLELEETSEIILTPTPLPWAGCQLLGQDA